MWSYLIIEAKKALINFFHPIRNIRDAFRHGDAA